MSTGYRIVSVAALVLLVVSGMASYYGWWLPTDASVRARNVREGSVRNRRFMGGGPGFGK